jgi:hypothetical protein
VMCVAMHAWPFAAAAWRRPNATAKSREPLAQSACALAVMQLAVMQAGMPLDSCNGSPLRRSQRSCVAVAMAAYWHAAQKKPAQLRLTNAAVALVSLAGHLTHRLAPSVQ